ncbi:exonuclease domain-containing protein [Myroides profundi]|uniref:DNA polymerase-3 subunit epsilon n=1 Tax=Myroides profundi TaxID=480520 RepID=A0AAJ4W5F7_MYRPR|nr:exonuclease domain-containing protein [Myroides profundi]AJH15203.1 DNA polymerase III subunit epsilon [Myroides profundi]SER23968.1 DNA polymerase-3 subunit epsilon [Myroides profundi]
MYAVLDIETTGGQFNEEGITEIAIYRFDGNQIVDQFISLVNPEMEIQPFVVKLTGINNAMLRLAPKFYEIAKRIIEITDNCVIVAHNAEFDYRVLRNEFKRLGYEYSRNTLCTVELSQKLLPDMPSYSLGKLVRSLGIPIADRHRANGDAMATEKLFELLLSKDKEKTILTSMIKSDIKTGISPKFLDIVDTLPSTVGIYYILDKEGNIIFIGKSKNIRKKVLQHFTSNSPIFKKIQQETYTVTFEKTGTELIALLKEAEEINTNKPKYNKVSKKSVFPYSIYLKTNLEGYLYLSIEKTDGRKRNLMAFTSPNEARKFLHKIFQRQQELPYVEFIYEKKSTKITADNFFINFTSTREEFNANILELFKPYDIDKDHVLILDKGRKVDEKSAVALEKGKLNGYCFYNLNHQINAPERIAANLTPILFNRNNRNIILNYLNKKIGYKLIHY